MLIYCFCLCWLFFLFFSFFFAFVLFSQNVLGRDKQNKLERDMSTKPTGMFCFRVSYHYPRGASSQLRSPGRVTFNSRPLRVKKQTASLASSSLTDTQYLWVATNPWLPWQGPVCTPQTRAIKQRELKGGEQPPELCSSLFVNHPPCILWRLCYGTRPCQWSYSEKNTFLPYIQADISHQAFWHSSRALCRGHVLLIMRPLKW